MHFLPQGSPLSHRSHASRERLKVTIKSPPPPAPPCSLSLLPSHSHSPSGRLRTVQILCHPLLTAPFVGNLDVLSWLPQWERSLPLPFPLSQCPQSSSSSSSSCPSFPTTPFTSDTGMLPRCLVGSACGFPSRPVVHVIRLTHVVDFHFRRLASFHFWWRLSRSLERYSGSYPLPSPSDDRRPPLSYRRRGVAVG